MYGIEGDLSWMWSNKLSDRPMQTIVAPLSLAIAIHTTEAGKLLHC